MAKKFNTNKGIRQFPDSATEEEIQSALLAQDITSFSPWVEDSSTAGGIGPAKLSPKDELLALKAQSRGDAEEARSRKSLSNAMAGKPDEDLSPLNTIASMLRPYADRAGAGLAAKTAAKLIPHPAAKGAAAVLGYLLTDQGLQEGQRQAFGQRPKGILEQMTDPNNEAIGRLMGTVENAGADALAGVALKSLSKVFKPKVKPPANPVMTGEEFIAKYNPRPQAEGTQSLFKPTNLRQAAPNLPPSIPPTPAFPGGTTTPSPFPLNRPVQPGAPPPLKEGAKLLGSVKQPLLLGKGPDRIIHLPGKPEQVVVQGSGKLFDQLIPNAIDSLRDGPVKLTVRQLQKTIDGAQIPIPQLERLITNPDGLFKALAFPETKQAIQGYWAQRTLQGAYSAKTKTFDITKLQESLSSPEVAKIYKPFEIAEIKRLFNAVGNGKGKTGDIQIKPEGIILSGAILAGLLDKKEGDEKTSSGFVFPIAALFGGIGRGAGTSIGRKFMTDYVEGRNITQPLRWIGKYVLRPMLAGGKALLQKHDGSNEEPVQLDPDLIEVAPIEDVQPVSSK